MLKVGITGNIGSGKTTVSKIFEVLGIPVFYADTAAKEVMVKDEILISAIKDAFGNTSYFDDGSLNRKHIANIVFNDEKELATLNSIVHPAVFRSFDNWVKQHHDVPYVLKEAALLFESDSYKMCDKTVMVTAPLQMRIQRARGYGHHAACAAIFIQRFALAVLRVQQLVVDALRGHEHQRDPQRILVG